ncbi:MAG: DUF4198 domain-containing protein [Lautropia sp.]
MNARSLAWAATVVSLGLAASLPLPAHAHRGWMLPSATVLSGDNVWVTVDAAVSNDLFYFEHQPMRLDNLKLYSPDGSPITAENRSTGRYRSTFDVRLTKPGTYRFAIENDGLFASYRLNGETKRVRGTAETLRKEIPAGAENVQVTRSQGRLEVFVTAGKPTTTALKPTGNGLELVPVTHPNDLLVGDEATFGLTIDGKPAAGIPVTVIPGGIRYRDQLGETKVVTGEDGRFKVKWPEPGMYWINASYPVRSGGGPGAGGAAGGTIDAPNRRANYTATVEVLPQ